MTETEDFHYWNGFDAAIQLVMTCLDNCQGYILCTGIKEEIIEEIEHYKKDD